MNPSMPVTDKEKLELLLFNANPPTDLAFVERMKENVTSPILKKTIEQYIEVLLGTRLVMDGELYDLAKEHVYNNAKFATGGTIGSVKEYFDSINIDLLPEEVQVFIRANILNSPVAESPKSLENESFEEIKALVDSLLKGTGAVQATAPEATATPETETLYPENPGYETAKFKVEVHGVGDPEGYYVSNALRFNTHEAAEKYAKDLSSHWMGMDDWRVVPVEAAQPMTTYKFRAEGEPDADLFYETNQAVIHNYKVEPAGTLDVEATFDSALSLDEIIALMQNQSDSHVMYETVKPISEYTGDRDDYVGTEPTNRIKINLSEQTKPEGFELDETVTEEPIAPVEEEEVEELDMPVGFDEQMQTIEEVVDLDLPVEGEDAEEADNGVDERSEMEDYIATLVSALEFTEGEDTKLLKTQIEELKATLEFLPPSKKATGGASRIKVGVFNEEQLKNKEDKKAVEKAQQETGLTYTTTKIIKKGGKMFLEVYLIPTEEYLATNKFAQGGSAGGEILIKPKHAHRDDVAELSAYLENNSWSYKRAKAPNSELDYFVVSTVGVHRDEVAEIKRWLEEQMWDWSAGGTSENKLSVKVFDDTQNDISGGYSGKYFNQELDDFIAENGIEVISAVGGKRIDTGSGYAAGAIYTLSDKGKYDTAADFIDAIESAVSSVFNPKVISTTGATWDLVAKMGNKRKANGGEAGEQITVSFYKWGQFHEEEEMDLTDLPETMLSEDQLLGFDIRPEDVDKNFYALDRDIDEDDDGVSVKRAYAYAGVKAKGGVAGGSFKKMVADAVSKYGEVLSRHPYSPDFAKKILRDYGYKQNYRIVQIGTHVQDGEHDELKQGEPELALMAFDPETGFTGMMIMGGGALHSNQVDAVCSIYEKEKLESDLDIFGFGVYNDDDYKKMEDLPIYFRKHWQDDYAKGGEFGINYNVVYEKPNSDIAWTEEINANSKDEAKEKFKLAHPTCKILNIGEQYAKGGSLIASYKEAVSEFNKELLTHPMVEKMAKHYGKTPEEVVKALQVRLSTKANKEGKTTRVYMDFTDTDSGIAVKHKKEFV
jgi:hypothetical protein